MVEELNDMHAARRYADVWDWLTEFEKAQVGGVFGFGVLDPEPARKRKLAGEAKHPPNPPKAIIIDTFKPQGPYYTTPTTPAPVVTYQAKKLPEVELPRAKITPVESFKKPEIQVPLVSPVAIDIGKIAGGLLGGVGQIASGVAGGFGVSLGGTQVATSYRGSAVGGTVVGRSRGFIRVRTATGREILIKTKVKRRWAPRRRASAFDKQQAQMQQMMMLAMLRK